MTVPRNHVKPGRMASLYRNAVLRQLSKLKHGVLTIQDPGGECELGRAEPASSLKFAFMTRGFTSECFSAETSGRPNP